jgi:putative flippase GtrA
VRARIGDNLTACLRVLHRRELITGARRETALRWLKFNLVGGLGIALQLAVLLCLKSGLHLNYLLATALAVEVAVVHNFIWHERYTWADRVHRSWRLSLPRLLRFNLAAGAISILGNLALMKLMVGPGHLNYLIANSAAIAVCSLLNFLVSEEWVFESEATNDHAALAVRPK